MLRAIQDIDARTYNETAPFIISKTKSFRIAAGLHCRLRGIHAAFTEPVKTTGPVGCCVGEPPIGSTLIASVAPSRRSAGSGDIFISPLAGMTPRDRGRVEPGAMAQSSKARSLGGVVAPIKRSINPSRPAVATQLG